MAAATSERSVVDVLRAARERITPEERWTVAVGARDSRGRSCDPTGEDAACWCAYGSVAAESQDLYADAVWYLNRAAPEQGKRGGSLVNDCLGHEATLTLFDRAIELAEAEA